MSEPDTTERESLRIELSLRKAAETRFRALLESAPDAMIVVNREGRIILINAQTEALFGYPGGELGGKPIESLIPRRLHEQHAQHREDCSAALRARPMGLGLPLVGLTKQGRELSIDVSLGPVVSESGTVVLSSVHEVNRSNRLEELQRE